jgi:hypothetical protein
MMTIDQQIAYVEQMRHLTKGQPNNEAERWTEIAHTLIKFKRAEAIAQELEGDFRALAGMSLIAKGLKAASIVTAKSNLFMEMGRIFLKF